MRDRLFAIFLVDGPLFHPLVRLSRFCRAVDACHLPLYMIVTTTFATWFGSETVLGIPAKFVEGGLGAVVKDPVRGRQLPDPGGPVLRRQALPHDAADDQRLLPRTLPFSKVDHRPCCHDWNRRAFLRPLRSASALLGSFQPVLSQRRKLTCLHCPGQSTRIAPFGGSDDSRGCTPGVLQVAQPQQPRSARLESRGRPCEANTLSCRPRWRSGIRSGSWA